MKWLYVRNKFEIRTTSVKSWRMEGLEDQNPMGEEMIFFLKVGKSKD